MSPDSGKFSARFQRRHRPPLRYGIPLDEGRAPPLRYPRHVKRAAITSRYHYARIAGLVQGLMNQLKLKGHPAFSSDEIQALRRDGYVFEPTRIKYLHGASGRCLGIAYEQLLKHSDWSLWTGFVLFNGVWSAHAWNLTSRMALIEPNADGRPKLYYGMESLANPESLRRQGLSEEQIRRFDAYATQWVGSKTDAGPSES